MLTDMTIRSFYRMNRPSASGFDPEAVHWRATELLPRRRSSPERTREFTFRPRERAVRASRRR
ncbi:hypothetical protein [Haladaptatus halobius]|uniref:hypothetical protein n=1 Tax=Haladaptatus halobius TaxID=2884875 RepID=UPI001D0A9CBB|nr:hypothetical protein [Haladaptatus halobius]